MNKMLIAIVTMTTMFVSVESQTKNTGNKPAIELIERKAPPARTVESTKHQTEDSRQNP